MVLHIKDMIKQVGKELGLEEEGRIFLGLVVFKERMAMHMLMRTLEVLRDLILHMPLS